MKIGKLRKKLKDKYFLENLYDNLTQEIDSWHSFYKFDCNENFRSKERLKRNLRLYRMNVEKLRRRIAFIESLLGIK